MKFYAQSRQIQPSMINAQQSHNKNVQEGTKESTIALASQARLTFRHIGATEDLYASLPES
jgi:hypothetical protein